MSATKGVLNDSRQVERAVSLRNYGARLQVPRERNQKLSYGRLLRLSKEVAGRSPSKGQLPFSDDWFLTWRPNIHAQFGAFVIPTSSLAKASALDDIRDAVMKAFKLYSEQIAACGASQTVLSITRAWRRRVKFIDAPHAGMNLTKPPRHGG
jgi:flagellar transcriptional activator FlhC